MLRSVVVGLDGSAESLAAAQWTAGEALRRGLPLRLLHAGGDLPSEPSHLPELDAPRRRAEDILRATLRQLEKRYPQLRPNSGQVALPRDTVRHGRPVDHLFHAAADACLLVVDRRVRPARLGMHIGPVAHGVMHQVACPVAVVPHN
ncbi:universal stress protein [Streptomyces sp. enrichment culture]|uniref:universal stress protein n=1 Tax=Streptomyces sp. enrichment culture TaxID=1795815 RepID=UPI003F569424